MDQFQARQLNPLVMAFVGDSAFTHFVRKKLAESSDSKTKALHLTANLFVKASAQATFLDKIEPLLTEEESDIARRTKNAHKKTKAKNATALDYKKSTAFEAVLGYLDLTEQTERLDYFMNMCYEWIKEDENEQSR